ncbi:hypothetical protein HHK36_014043 [Tetracentron sinense]|uniref:BRCT domain-containing protein n=1 Tax=Tetracentron sinense TaxID=13715 RepID=A0A835DDW5_TETSI|nr:hypothetical protein HHK36_014043 [Tetracentron sinense]
MSDSKSNPYDGGNKTVRRNLPSWMSSRGNESKSHGKKPAEAGAHEEDNDGEKPKQVTGYRKAHSGSTKSKETESNEKSAASSMEGVVFVLSGFVNPDRGILRSQALEMGAEYQPDWNSDCTLLVCAFSNTPKFRQVEECCGTIVSKDWISECYNQKMLVAIESYLMHAGKPWRRTNISHVASQDQEISPPRKPRRQVERKSLPKPTISESSERGGASNPVKECFSPPKLKKWAFDDLNKTISWLESQEERPEPSEIKKIAAEGILTCLQDAIESLKQKQDIGQMIEQWKFVPCVVKELARLEDIRSSSASLPKEDLYQHAISCKHIYEVALNNLTDDDSIVKRKRSKTDEGDRDDNEKAEVLSGDAAYDTDETIEMTEEEIDLAYKTIATKFC